MIKTAILRVVLLGIGFFAIGAIHVSAQDSSKPAGNGDSAGSTGDRFPEHKAEVDRLRAIYDPLHESGMAEIEGLLRSKRCQIQRINGLLTRNSEAMHAWLNAEKAYWKAWDDAEQSRVALEAKSIANIEAEQARAADFVSTNKKELEELQRQRTALQQGPQTAATRARIDLLVTEIQESQAKLTNAQRIYDGLNEKLTNDRANLTVKLIQIRKNQNSLDAYGIEEDANFESLRTKAQEICSTKVPETKKKTSKGGQK